MKKIKLLITAVILVIISAPAAFAKPQIAEYTASGFSVSSLRTVLVMPVEYSVNVPGEAFFAEKINQKWLDLTSQSSGRFSFVCKTPADVISRDAFVKGTAETEALSPTAAAAKALRLAPDYVDAVLVFNVTKCGYTTIHHPEERYMETYYEDQSVYVDGKWISIRVPRQRERVNPAWDESIASASSKLELRGAKNADLLYGNAVQADTGGGLFSSAPSLTTQMTNVMINAVKKIPTK